MSFGTKIYTWLYGNLVGIDDQQNKYYCNSSDFTDIDAKRWVIFNGVIEATKIPPQWHSWLHKTIDIPPYNYKHKYFWQKDHEQNMTGTNKAYYPSSHPLSKSYNNEEVKKEYDSWNP
ncbi:NADH-ubiquinone oxidoreductase subunit NDUFA12 family protein [Alphaproteobacteria bacterium]|nr:NADH-ubiquinone oxidoreductase subunit NDUFA12 family protein [Alphaproteobacteria bacterium]